MIPLTLFYFHLIPLYSQKLEIISSVRISVESQDENVKQNLRQALGKINNLSLSPGSVFSFNELVGKGSLENGYKTGRVYYRDEVIYEPGGGLCILSTALYNTFLLAGFQIIERHKHSKPISYAPLGLDATIRYGNKDLKMKNQHKQSFRLKVSLSERSLFVALLGEEKLSYRYEPRLVEEEDLYGGLEEDGKEYLNGWSVNVFLDTYDKQNRLLKSQFLYNDFIEGRYTEKK